MQVVVEALYVDTLGVVTFVGSFRRKKKRTTRKIKAKKEKYTKRQQNKMREELVQSPVVSWKIIKDRHLPRVLFYT